MNATNLHLNKFGQLIMETTSSMTRLIEVLYDVELKAHLIRQQEMKDCPPLIQKNQTIQDQGRPILRQLCLTDRHLQPYYYADVVFYQNEIAPHVRQDLYHTDTPIGKIIDKYQLEIYRQILDYGKTQNEQVAKHLGIPPEEWLAYKVTSIQHQAKDLFYICEYFPIQRLKLEEGFE